MHFESLPDSRHAHVGIRPLQADDIPHWFAWAHAHVGIARVQATVLDSNARSLRVLERCGFRREGLLRSYRMVRGTPGDFWMYSHLPGDGMPPS